MSDEQDFTDPAFVLGAVLAQLEELEPVQKIEVLAQAMTLAIADARNH